MNVCQRRIILAVIVNALFLHLYVSDLVTRRSASVVKVSVIYDDMNTEAFKEDRPTSGGQQQTFNFVLRSYIILKCFITQFYTINKCTHSCSVKNVFL